MHHDFEHHAAKGNEILNMLAYELDLPGNKRAALRILRAVLHALRNRITTEESIQLLAQLPMMLKAVYVDGWNLKKHHENIRTLEAFLNDIINNDKAAALEDFTMDDETAADTAATTFRVLGRYISRGEYNDVLQVLPEEIREFIKESI